MGIHDMALPAVMYVQKSWPEPNIYTVYDRIFGHFPAKNTVFEPRSV